MGFWERVKSQFIDVIEWTEEASDTLSYRFPTYAKEIQMGGQLTVRETQSALFVNEGKMADLFTPGRYQLSTQNLPILTTLRSWAYGFNSPFKSEVYFFNMRQFTNVKWGTSNPLTVRDPEIGPVRIRAFGNFALKINAPKIFFEKVVGTREITKLEDVAGQLRANVVSGFSDLFAESKIPFLDAAANLKETSERCRASLLGEFAAFGLGLDMFVIENISVPPEVEKMLDKRAAMGLVPDMQKYAQFQAADAIKDAAQNTGGGAGAGVGLGAGIAMGQTMMDAMKGGGAPAPQNLCGKCQVSILATAKFCPNCGTPQA
jgi:membrane protease subunit (stomatin/prohibitin family)